MDSPIQHNARVLVVEDEVDISSSLAYALRASGYEVLVADRGESALSSLDTFQPDLVLLDLMLPDMPGIAQSVTIKSNSCGVWRKRAKASSDCPQRVTR